MGWIPTWRGEAVNWECDELGHLNMRHYAAKMEEARQYLFIHLGLAHAFQPSHPSTVRTTGLTVCYLKEARPGVGLSIRSGLVELGESTATVAHVMEHVDGSPAATFLEEVAHIYLPDDRAFPWPARLREKWQTAEVESACRPRGLADVTVEGPSLSRLESLGAQRIGSGVFRPDEADSFGRLRPHAYLGRWTESVGNFTAGWPEMYGENGIYADRSAGDARYSGVLLELRVHIHREAEPGQAFVALTSLTRATPNIRNFIHHLVDPVSGRSYASAQATSAVIDLHERKLVKTGAEVLTALEASLTPQITA